MKIWAPTLWGFCDQMLTGIEAWNPSLKRPFEKCPFATMTFNLGPVVCTCPHQDYKNLAGGWCAVTSFGDFDPKTGGHIILWDLKIAIEFPPHATIFIPSAIVEHSNTAVGKGETRRSITHYNSAGLFRWIAYGYMPKWKAEELKRKPEKWWSQPTHKFSKVPPPSTPPQTSSGTPYG